MILSETHCHSMLWCCGLQHVRARCVCLSNVVMWVRVCMLCLRALSLSQRVAVPGYHGTRVPGYQGIGVSLQCSTICEAQLVKVHLKCTASLQACT